MNKVDKLFSVLDTIKYPLLMSKIDHIWTTQEDSVLWNGDDNVQDLLNGDGVTYQGYVPEGGVEWGGYWVCNVDTSTGVLETLFFDLKKKV